MSARSEPFQVVGYYSQPYNELVHPDRVWRVSKYFLRRWGPYLSPSRFWAIVAARQFAYWNDKCHWFTAYDKRFAREAQLSTIHFRRLKLEVNQADQAISLFLTKKELADDEKYHVVNGQTKPKPTTYTIRLDDPLTPADGLHLANWLQQNCQRQASSVASVLREAREIPRKALLAPLLAPYLADPPAEFRYLSVLHIVERVFGSQIAQNEKVKEEADLLHAHLTGPDYYGKEYFRRQWVNTLKPGPAFLLTYLRSFCFLDETTGELRNVVTFTRPELADSLGVTTKTIVNWLQKLETAVPPQALSTFITLVEQQRLSSNDVQYKYQIEMLEPLSKKDLPLYQKRLESLEITEKPNPDGKNDDHEGTTSSTPDGKNDSHESGTNGKNEDHETATEPGGVGKNENHDPDLMEKMRTPDRSFDNGSRKKRWPFKYYQTLFQTVIDKDVKTLAAADWSPTWKMGNDRALASFACAACENDYDKLFDLLNIDKRGPSRERMKEGSLSIAEIVAWYLYAIGQKGLSKPPVNMTIARAQDGVQPPQKYLKLAQLSWELWRCYACLLVLEPSTRAAFDQAPAYEIWMRQYGRYHPDDLPLQVGVGVSETMNMLLYGASGEENWEQPRVVSYQTMLANGRGPDKVEVEKELQKLWQSVLREVKGSMTKATFDAWMMDSILLHVEEDDKRGCQKWVVGVRNPSAIDWLENRLNKAVIEPVATAVHGKAIAIHYVVG